MINIINHLLYNYISLISVIIFRLIFKFIVITEFIKIRGATAPKSQHRLKWFLPDGSTWDLVVSKALSLNINFSFINRISLLLISSSYAIGLTRLGGPRSRTYRPT